MPNIAELNPADITEEPDNAVGPSPASTDDPQQATTGNVSDLDPSDVQSEDEFNQSQYGTPAQTVLGGAEQVAQGVLGPIAPALEESTGLTTGADIRGRQKALGMAAPVLQGAGLVGSALIPGLGEASLAGLASNIGEHAAGLLPEASGLLANVAATGVKTGAEMAALSTSDELSKMVTGDPDQTLGNAAIRIGLSGILGGAGGAVLGSVSPLWNTVGNKLPVINTMKDMLSEMKFWDDANVTPLEGAVKDVNGQIQSAQQMMYGGMKPELVEKLTADVDPSKIADHAEDVENIISNADPSLKRSPVFQDAVNRWRSVMYPNGLAPATEDVAQPAITEEVQEALPNLRRPTLGRNALGQFKSIETPETLGEVGPEITQIHGSQPSLFSEKSLAPQAAMADPSAAFRATEDFKRSIQKIAEPAYAPPIFQTGMSPETRATVYAAKDTAKAIRPTLEDSAVWGAAGTAQKTINKAMSPMFDFIPDFMKTVASKEAGEGVADPGKLETLLNQTEKGKGAAVLKANKVNNLLQGNKDLADAINSQYLANNMEPPFQSQINDTPYLNRILNTPQTTGVKLAQWMRRNGAAALAGEAGHIGGGGIGAGLGWLVGHPMVGAYIGDRLLKPIISGLAKPFAENAVSSEGAKTAVDYLSHVAKGQKLLSESIANFLKPGALVIGKDLIPDEASRGRLNKSLEVARNPSSLMKVGGSIGSYLPQHATAAAKVAAQATNYLESLKPKQPQTGMLDEPIPVDKNAQAKYDRALDIAQQPLMVLKHAKDGTLLPQDIQTIQTIYPAVRQEIAQKLGEELVNAKNNGVTIPYQQKLGIAAILGQPIDSLMAQPAMMSIMSANAPVAMPAQMAGKSKKVSKSTASSMLKVNSLYQTPEQARASSRTRDIGS